MSLLKVGLKDVYNVFVSEDSFVRGMESVLDTTGIIIRTITYTDRIDHLNEDGHYYYFVSNCNNFLSGQHSHNSIKVRGQIQNVFSSPDPTMILCT